MPSSWKLITLFGLVLLGSLEVAEPIRADAVYVKPSAPKAAIALVVSDWQNSTPLKLTELRGQVVVLKFWATWAAPSKASLVQFESAAKSLKGKVVFIGVHTTRGSNGLAAFMARNKFSFIACVDSQDRTCKRYGVNALPLNVIIDKKGNIAQFDAEIDETALAKMAK